MPHIKRKGNYWYVYRNRELADKGIMVASYPTIGEAWLRYQEYTS